MLSLGYEFTFAHYFTLRNQNKITVAECAWLASHHTEFGTASIQRNDELTLSSFVLQLNHAVVGNAQSREGMLCHFALQEPRAASLFLEMLLLSSNAIPSKNQLWLCDEAWKAIGCDTTLPIVWLGK